MLTMSPSFSGFSLGNAVADDVVDRGAGRLAVAAIHQGRRHRAVVACANSKTSWSMRSVGTPGFTSPASMSRHSATSRPALRMPSKASGPCSLICPVLRRGAKPHQRSSLGNHQKCTGVKCRAFPAGRKCGPAWRLIRGRPCCEQGPSRTRPTALHYGDFGRQDRSRGTDRAFAHPASFRLRSSCLVCHLWRALLVRPAVTLGLPEMACEAHPQAPQGLV